MNHKGPPVDSAQNLTGYGYPYKHIDSLLWVWCVSKNSSTLGQRRRQHENEEIWVQPGV